MEEVLIVCGKHPGKSI